MQKKQKVLLLNVNRTNWHSGNMIYDMEVVSRACETVIYGPGWDNYKHSDVHQIIKQIYGEEKPDVIYSYFMPNEIVSNVYMEHYKIPDNLRIFPTNLNSISGIAKIFVLSDFWAKTKWEYAIGLPQSGFSHCFCCFTPPYSNPDDFYAFFDENVCKKIKFIAMPRCLDDNCFKPYHKYEDKEYDVITAGSMCDFYPFRVWMRNSLNNIS